MQDNVYVAIVNKKSIFRVSPVPKAEPVTFLLTTNVVFTGKIQGLKPKVDFQSYKFFLNNQSNSGQ